MEQNSSNNNVNNNENNNNNNMLPTMIVFDLDDCLWSPEMHELPGAPIVPIEGNLAAKHPNKEREHRQSQQEHRQQRGVVGMKVPPNGPTVYLYDGARKALYDLATNPDYKDIIVAVASSSLEPSYSHMCLEGIEILPGCSVRDLITYEAIGRHGRLSPNKISHFTVLHEESQIPYEEMLFFDDCNWGDHCQAVTKRFGVVSYRTPYGLQYEEFQEALNKYHRIAEKRTKQTTKALKK